MSERLVTVAPARKRIVVAGGGPAGLKVAEIAARRGHQVTLLERANRLGGQVLLAAVQPEHDTIGEVTAYLEAATAELGVTIKVGTEATVDSSTGARAGHRRGGDWIGTRTCRAWSPP